MWFSVGIALLVGQALATPHSLQKRQGNDCPPIHIFGARETTAPPGFGAAAKIVDDLTKANQGATNEAINYPACGGGTDCLGVSYADSVKNGTDSVATAINDFNKRCPQTKIVMLGFSQVSDLSASTTQKLTKTRVRKSWTTHTAAAVTASKESKTPTCSSRSKRWEQ